MHVLSTEPVSPDTDKSIRADLHHTQPYIEPTSHQMPLFDLNIKFIGHGVFTHTNINFCARAKMLEPVHMATQ